MCLNNKQEGKLLLNLELVQGTVTKVANELVIVMCRDKLALVAC